MSKKLIDLGLVQVTPKEAGAAVKMMIHDAKELAGQFHGMDRSEKFRTNWPDEYKFASANWKSVIQEVIQVYAVLMGRAHVAEEDKHRMYVARLMWEKMGEGQEKDNRLQLFKNSLQFVGDRYENRKIKEQFGTHKNFRAHVLNSVVTRH